MEKNVEKKIKVDFEDLAKKLMFDLPSFVEFMKRGGLVFKKGKDASSVNDAIRKAQKNGNQKVENELGMLELYLKDVFLSTYTPTK